MAGMENSWNKKKGVLAGLLVFMGFMALCTIAAKGIYRNGLPRVWMCRAEKKSLHYEINGTGTILPGAAYGVYVPQGLRVYTVAVRVGAWVQEGDVLFELDGAELESRIQEVTAEQNYLKAQLDDLAAEKNRQSQEKKKLEEQLLADYENLAAQQDLLVSNAKLAAESAKLRMEEAGETGSDTEYALCKKDYERAKNAVDQARIDRQEALQEWSRRLEDARAQISQETAQRVRLQGELAAHEQTLAQLKLIREAEGQVSATEEGIVTGCLVETGGRTGDGPCVLYARTGDGVEVTLPEAEARLLSIGDKVSLQCKSSLGENKRFEGIVRYQEGANGQRTLQIEADVSGLPAGQTVSMNYSCNSESYAMVIPERALHTDTSGSCWVYVVEEVEGILGTEYRTRKIPVTVQERNGEYAAVTGAALSPDSDIIERSNKEFAENAAVRVME